MIDELKQQCKNNIKELLEDLAILYMNNEDDFDRGRGGLIINEFIEDVKKEYKID